MQKGDKLKSIARIYCYLGMCVVIKAEELVIIPNSVTYYEHCCFQLCKATSETTENIMKLASFQPTAPLSACEWKFVLQTRAVPL